jgi:hypothetical protein
VTTKKNAPGLHPGQNSTADTTIGASAANVTVPAPAVSPEDMRAALPAELRELRGWLLWRYEQVPANKERRKVPHYVSGGKRSGTNGSPKDRERLATFEEAMASLARGGFDGLGVAMLPEHDLVVVDIDRKATTTEPLTDAEADELCAGTYSEVSPGGKGRHVFLRGRMADGKNHTRGVEVFSEAGFVTVTGRTAVPGQAIQPLSDDRRQQLARYVNHSDDGPRTPGNKQPLGIDMKAARELLDHLPFRWCDEYGDWLRAGMALHHEFDGAAGALELWDEWSQRSGKYVTNECARKWDTFGRSGKDEVTMRTLVRDAQATGWRAPATVARAVADFEARHAGSELVIVTADQVDIESTDWLWPGRLPRRFLSVYAADSGSGKSTATAAIAAVLTRGGLWPDDDPLAARLEPSDVLWLGVEDPLAQVTVPRLMAAGADLGRIHVLQGVKVPGADGEELFSLQDDLTLLRQFLQRMRADGRPVSLMVVDPVTAYLHGKRRIDAYKATELRSVLTPFAQLAADEDIAVICITHLTKDKTRGFIDSVLGSQALVALSRNVWGFARVPGEGDNSLAMFWGKGNLDRAALPTLRFHVEGAEVISKEGEMVKTSKVVWDGEDSTVTRETIYGSGTRGPVPTARNEAVAWLRERLGDGQWHDSTSIADDAIAAGFSAGTLRRASEEVCERQQHRGRGRWRLVPTGR